MPIFSISTLRSSFGDARGRVFTVVECQPSLFARSLTGMLAIVVLALFLILLIPAVLIAAAVGLIAAASYAVRRALRATHEPNGILDGRRNVRVVVRDAGDTPSA